MRVRFLEAAAEEVYRAVEHYDQQSPGLGLQLLGDLEELTTLLAAHPDLGSPGDAGTRRSLMSRFPFGLVYLVAGEEIVVVALAHQRRKPGYWTTRV